MKIMGPILKELEDTKGNQTKGKVHSMFTNKNVTTVQNFRVFVNSFTESGNDIHGIWNNLLNAGSNDTLELRIASPGGYVTECQNFINIMRNKFKDRTTTYIDSHASSAGAITFLAGDKRVIYENSRIMIHNYAGGYSGEYKKMKTRIDFDEKHIIGFLKSIIRPKASHKFLSKKEFKEMVNGKEFWFRTDEMAKRKICTHVIVDGEEMTAKQYLKSIKV